MYYEGNCIYSLYSFVDGFCSWCRIHIFICCELSNRIEKIYSEKLS